MSKDASERRVIMKRGGPQPKTYTRYVKEERVIQETRFVEVQIEAYSEEDVQNKYEQLVKRTLNREEPEAIHDILSETTFLDIEREVLEWSWRRQIEKPIDTPKTLAIVQFKGNDLICQCGNCKKIFRYDLHLYTGIGCPHCASEGWVFGYINDNA